MSGHPIRPLALFAAAVAAVLAVTLLLGAERADPDGAARCVARLQKLRQARQALALNWHRDGTIPDLPSGPVLRDRIIDACLRRGWLTPEDLVCESGKPYALNSVIIPGEPVVAGCQHGDLCWNQEIRLPR